MTRLITIVLLFMVLNTGYSQAMLGNDRSDVILTVRNPEKHFHQIEEGMTKSGYPYISATDIYDDLAEWIFDEGRVVEYIIIVDSDDLNDFIEVLNKKYVREKPYQWCDYTGGNRVYWWIKAGEKFYYIHSSYSDPEL